MFDIGIDLDGCLYDFVTKLGDSAAARTGRPRSAFPPALSWNFYCDQWAMTLEEYLELFREAVLHDNLLRDGAPFPGVTDGWASLTAAGHRLWVITDRSPAGAIAEAQDATHDWLAEHNLAPHAVMFARDKTKICDVAQSDQVFFIEDRVENVRALRAAGVQVMCQRRPWNDGHDFDYVESFEHFTERIHQASTLQGI